MDLSHTPLVLGSRSPQRRRLLAKLGLAFEVLSPLLDHEEIDPDVSFGEAIAKLALAKAESLKAVRPHALILGADTAIYHQGRVFGKPKDRQEARTMLQALSGQTHAVWTGVGLWIGPREEGRSFACESLVRFKSLSPQDIRAYLDSGEWEGRAGAYAIQETGHKLIADIKGSFDNIVGLPVAELEDLFAELKEEGGRSWTR